MKNIILYTTLAILLFSCKVDNEDTSQNPIEIKSEINKLLDDWHLAAAKAQYNNYFNAMDSTSVFVGTAAEEVWTKDAFQQFSKPYFDKGKAWSFKSVDRNIYTGELNNIVWFDELLDTWMGLCRGSGVIIKVDKNWKIKHYVLSVAVPNEDIQPIINIKKERDSLYMLKIKK